jgi:predicted dehydrogenase
LPSALQVAVCGAGSFGQNHIRVYHQLEQDGIPVHLAAIIDPALAGSPNDLPSPREHENQASSRPGQSEPDRSQTPTSPQAARIFHSIEACLAARAEGKLHLDAVSICTPTSLHAAVAAAALKAGLHILVEKPITRTIAEADHLIALGREHNRIVQVGHLERFNPAVQAFLPYLNRPMFFEAHRLSIFTPRSLDVDVVLDLMVHDLDVVLTFVKSPVREIRAVGLPILSRKTDIANVRVEFESGCVANFTASRVSTERVRKLRFFQPHQYVSIDYARQEILLIETTSAGAPGLASETWVQTMAKDPMKALKITKPEVRQGEPLRLEIESFLNAIRTNTRPLVSGEDGRAALSLALDITTAIEAHIENTGLHSSAASS